MSTTENPFTPIFGQIPLHMAGRKHLIESMKQAFSAHETDPNWASMLVGARGTGKTALLSLIGKNAESSGWVTVNVTALPGMLDNIYEQALKRTAHLVGEPRESSAPRLTGITVGGFGVEWSRDSRDPLPPQTWRTRMEYLFDELSETKAGLLICVDEVDPQLPEMAELAACYQHFLRDGRRAGLLMAGLPSHVLALISSKSVSFLRRACQHRIGRVADYEMELAFEQTVIDGGKTISPDALREAVRIIDGFPFMMQLLGYRCWIAAAHKDAIELEDVRSSAQKAERELRERVYDTMYHELSAGDRDFLAAMLRDSGASSLSDLRERLGKNPQQLSYQKKRLIGQGLVRDETRGFVTFDMPGIREYLQEQLE